MKLLKLFRRRRSRKGFTLVELIVVIAIIAILMACVVAFAQPIRSMMSDTNARSDAITINNGLGNYIERRLAFANEINLFVGDIYYSTDQVTAYKNMYDKHHSTNDSPRMMVFEYDAVKGNFKVYDLAITSDTMPPMAMALTKANLIYSDDYYGPYSYFITCDDIAPQANPMKQKAYLNFRIDSYHFGDSGKQITQTDVTHYYKYINDNKAGDNPLDQYAFFRSGSENVSFGLENIKVEVKYQPATYADGSPMMAEDGVTQLITPVPNVSGNVQINRPNPSTGYNMVVIYNVRQYSVADIK